MIETGTILQNRYRVEKQIGQGGMGNVYVATDERFKSTVAIKETIFEDANLRKAFEREARLLNSLKHSALPRVSDHFGENDGQFLVMEFIAGDDLAAMMEKNGEAFPLETVLNWANQLCNALEYLHNQDIIHRDIKPQNLKLTPKGEIVLLDFGLAKGNATDAANQTAAKSIFGFSRNYASLEQIQGAGTEPRSDLYSLSATIYHLLTGIPPADALTRAMNVLNGKSDPLIPANFVNRKVPNEVADILQRAMALKADERPATAAEMRQMLDESDKTVDLSAASLIGDDVLSAEFLTQDTKIIGAKTNLSADSQIKTKITANDSSARETYQTAVDNSDTQATVLRPIAATQTAKRSKTFGAAAFGILALVGMIFSAGYLMNADSTNISAEEKPKTETINNITANQWTNSEIPVAGNSNAPDANSALAELDTKESTEKPAVAAPVQPAETTKTDAKESKKQTVAAKSNKTKEDSENIVVNDERVEMGDIIIDDSGIRDRKTGKSIIPAPPEPGESPVQPRALSPEQLRQLETLKERMKNRKNRFVIVKTPTPPKAPQTPEP